MEKVIYIATGNKAKVADFQRFFSWIDSAITVQLVPDYIDVDEVGKTIAENSKLKTLPYIDKYKFPVIANDSGLAFDKKVIEITDPSKSKRNALGELNEADLSQEEVSKMILDYYRDLAKKYGGKIDCIMEDVFTILLPNGEIHQESSIREYELVDRDTDKCDIYYPLNSLRISKRVGKYMDEIDEKEDKIDRKVLVDALERLIKRI